MYREDWTGVQARIFCAWKSQTAAGRGGCGRCWKSTGGQADDQRNHFSPSRLRKNYVGARDRRAERDGPNEVGTNLSTSRLSRASRVMLHGRWRTFSAPCYLKFQLFVS
jgi:hypothetical protein